AQRRAGGPAQRKRLQAEPDAVEQPGPVAGKHDRRQQGRNPALSADARRLAVRRRHAAAGGPRRRLGRPDEGRDEPPAVRAHAGSGVEAEELSEVIMISTLALALLLSQDPKPAAKTVEERLKELVD